MTKLKPRTTLENNIHTRENKAAANRVLSTLSLLLDIELVSPIELSVSARLKKLKVTL